MEISPRPLPRMTSLQGGILFLVTFISFFWLHWIFVASWAFRDLSCCGERGHSPAVVHWLLTAVTSLVAEQGLSSCGFQALERRVNHCGTKAYFLQGTWGIFPDRGSNPCLLHWQEDSLPLSRQGSPEGLLWKQSPGRQERADAC